MLCAQTEELPEIQSEILQDNWLQKLYDELDFDGHQLSLNSRFHFSEHSTNALLAMQLIERDIQLNTNLYSTKAGPLRANFLVSRRNPKTTLKELHIGFYRPTWGLGTVLKQNYHTGQLFGVLHPSHPLYTSPQGIALRVSENDFNLFLMASLNRRYASVTNDKIDYLYTSQREDLGRVYEKLLGGGLEYRKPSFALGAMAYYQGYDKEFSNPAYKRDLEALSLSGELNSNTSFLAAEASLINGDGALAGLLGYKIGKVEQSFGFSYRENIQLPAYSAKPFLLSPSGKRTELYWNVEFPPAENFILGLRHAALRHNNSLEHASWLTRSIATLSYHPQGTTALLQLSRLDREIVELTDSAYSFTRPVHYRGKLQFNQHISKPLELKVLFRYYYEDRESNSNNSFFWENALIYKRKALQLEAGLQSWQSLRSILSAEDELSDPLGYTIATSEDNQVFAGAKYRWRSLHLGAELHQSWLSNKRSIYVSVGI